MKSRDNTAAIARRVELERRIADLSRRPLDDSTLNSAAVVIVGVVALSAVVAMLGWPLA